MKKKTILILAVVVLAIIIILAAAGFIVAYNYDEDKTKESEFYSSGGGWYQKSIAKPFCSNCCTANTGYLYAWGKNWQGFYDPAVHAKDYDPIVCSGVDKKDCGKIEDCASLARSDLAQMDAAHVQKKASNCAYCVWVSCPKNGYDNDPTGQGSFSVTKRILGTTQGPAPAYPYNLIDDKMYVPTLSPPPPENTNQFVHCGITWKLNP